MIHVFFFLPNSWKLFLKVYSLNLSILWALLFSSTELQTFPTERKHHNGTRNKIFNKETLLMTINYTTIINWLWSVKFFTEEIFFIWDPKNYKNDLLYLEYVLLIK
jgi:hypothetical protein